MERHPALTACLFLGACNGAGAPTPPHSPPQITPPAEQVERKSPETEVGVEQALQSPSPTPTLTLSISSKDENCRSPELRQREATPFLLIEGYGRMASFLGTGDPIPLDFSLDPEEDEESAKSLVCKRLEEARTDQGPFDCESAKAWALSEDVGGRTVTPRGWRILALGNGRFAAFNEAPVRSTVHPHPEFHLTRYGRYVVSEIDFPRWACPNSPDDQCVRWHPKNGHPKDFYCASSADLKCTPAGVEAQLTLLDEQTGLMAEVGPLKRQERPQLTLDGDALAFPTSECGIVSIKVADTAHASEAQTK